MGLNKAALVAARLKAGPTKFKVESRDVSPTVSIELLIPFTYTILNLMRLINSHLKIFLWRHQLDLRYDICLPEVKDQGQVVIILIQNHREMNY